MRLLQVCGASLESIASSCELHLDKLHHIIDGFEDVVVLKRITSWLQVQYGALHAVLSESNETLHYLTQDTRRLEEYFRIKHPYLLQLGMFKRQLLADIDSLKSGSPMPAPSEYVEAVLNVRNHENETKE